MSTKRKTPHGWRVEKKIGQIKDLCRSTGRHYDLSDSTLRTILTSPCYYCGIEPKLPLPGGVDRLDPGFGYDTGNTVPICGLCSRAKGPMSEKDYLSRVFKIAHRHIDRLVQIDPELSNSTSLTNT